MGPSMSLSLLSLIAVQYFGACLAGVDVAMLVMEHCSVRSRLSSYAILVVLAAGGLCT